MSELSVTTLKHESATSDNITLASNGNVGIGTSSPSRRLHLSAAGTDCAIRVDNTVSGRPFLLAYDDSQNLTITNSSDSGNISFVNGTGAGTARLRIDSAGRVTMPYQPHARVSRNTGAIAGGNVIVFNFADENTAGVYNASNGRFTAPVAGRYLFAHGMFSHNGYNAYLAWRVNGTVIATTYDSDTNYDSVAGSIVLSMSAGDYADLFVVAGASYQIYGTTAVQCWATFTLLS
jgi:hypothetical protein